MKTLFFFLLLPLFALAFEPIQSIEQVKQHAADQTLIVFDVDDTLTVLRHPAYHLPNYIKYDPLYDSIMSSLTKDEEIIAFNLPLAFCPSDLIENNTPMWIQEMQQKGMRTIALTAALGAKIGEHAFEDCRIAELKRVGIDFSTAFPDLPTFSLHDYKPGALGVYPLFKQGVIFANYMNKGKVLVHFLKTSKWTPKKIIFVDDRMEHVLSVEQEIKAFDPSIEVVCLHFCGHESFYQDIDEAAFIQTWTEMADLAKVINRGT